MTLHPFNGPRGLRGFTRFTASYGETVELRESSAVAITDETGAVIEIVTTGSPDYAWLHIEGERGGERTMFASAHLSRDNAIELRGALNAFLDSGQIKGDNSPRDALDMS